MKHRLMKIGSNLFPLFFLLWIATIVYFEKHHFTVGVVILTILLFVVDFFIVFVFIRNHATINMTIWRQGKVIKTLKRTPSDKTSQG